MGGGAAQSTGVLARSTPAAAGYRRSGKTSCAAQMSDIYQRLQMSDLHQRDEVVRRKDTVPVSTDTNPPSF